MKRLSFLFLFLFFVQKSFCGGNHDGTVTDTSIPVSSISLNFNSYVIGETNTLQLIAEVSPSNAGNRDLSWSSSNTAVATVDANGLVTAQGKGTSTITCASCDGSGVNATCEVYVPMVYVTDFTLNKTSRDMEVGETFQLIATVKPSNATYQVLSWSSNTPSVVSVSSNGLITALSAGEATITCTVSDGEQHYFAVPAPSSTTCMVTVRNQQQEIIENIDFTDVEVKRICVENWDTNGDGELSYAEAAAVTDLGQVFNSNRTIASFNELAYFTNLTEIPQEAFDYCGRLTSVIIPNSVTNIGENAFDNCYSLPHVIIPNSVTSISRCAFRYCSGLKSITIPSSVLIIGEGAFLGCSALASIIVEDGNSKYDSRNNCNAIIETETNTLFAGCQNTIIPDDVTKIGDYAFYGCRGLTAIVIPGNVKKIGEYAFGECQDLISINISNSVTSIGNRVFYGCNSMASIIVEDGNSKYDSRNNCNAIIETETNTLFAGCQNTIIPDNVTNIGDYAFYGCRGLTSVFIPNSIVSIGNGAFSECTGLTSVVISKNVKSIGSSFGLCGNLASIVIEGGNTKYDSRNNCNAIIETETNTLIVGCQNTIIPNDVTSIGNNAFYYCSNLTSIDIPNSVKTIGNGAFSGCGKLMKIIIPNSVTTIGDNAFYYCNKLKSVDIHSNETSIGQYAFWSCPQLMSVMIQMLSPASIDSYSFYNYNNVTLYVPFGCKTTYEAADVWKDFKEIIEVKPDNFLYAEETTMKLGGKKTIALQLDNVTPLIATEFRLQLPTGLTIEKDENNNPVVAIVNDRCINHTLTVTDEGNGLYHFLSYSNPIRAYKGNSGDFITLSIVSDGSMEEGTYTATLKGIIFSDENEQKLTFDDCSFNISVINYTTGDANGDGSIDVMDVVKMVSHIMGRNPSSFNQIAADIDGNGKVNVMDLVNLINLIMTTPQQTSGIAPHAQVGSMELSKSGDEAIAVSIPFVDRHVAAQFVVSVTDGAVLQEVVADEAHQSKFTRMNDGRYKVMVFSGNNATFNSNSPIKLQLSGNGDVKIEDAMFVDIDEEAVAFESAVLNTTGITTVGTTFAQPVDIYTVGGKLVKNGATSTKGLAKGVYVVNNQKLIVK